MLRNTKIIAEGRLIVTVILLYSNGLGKILDNSDDRYFIRFLKQYNIPIATTAASDRPTPLELNFRGLASSLPKCFSLASVFPSIASS